MKYAKYMYFLEKQEEITIINVMLLINKKNIEILLIFDVHRFLWIPWGWGRKFPHGGERGWGRGTNLGVGWGAGKHPLHIP
jgi:hypothetical protein